MVGWHHQLDGHEFEQALGVGEETDPAAGVQRLLEHRHVCGA